eukprot:TRINITY_DN2789_c0_g2_i1.p2 TRINITY_DN2789_c0_g2~~TRINITY_DN2789_c0_g2_i1.p2  ORF type:complete len:102 (+),score=18.55 TRINITY_DN2789_c0_g2_i1:776-1081(+)
MERSLKSILITGACSISSQKEMNMSQHRWMEYIKDYDFPIKYHTGKGNVVAYALNRKSVMLACMQGEWALREQFRNMDFDLQLCSDGVMIAAMYVFEPTII